MTTTCDRIDSARAQQMAATLWQGFTPSEISLVRFGMFPAAKMKAADDTLKAEGFDSRDMSRLLAVALMEIAEKRGGMIA